MCNWSRKQLLTLTDEIRALLICDALPPSLRTRLTKIYDAAKTHARHDSTTAGDVERVRKELSACKQDPYWRVLNRVLLESLEHKRNVVLNTVALMGGDSTKQSVDTECFMNWLSKEQVIVAELFAQEENVIRSIGLPDCELSRHIVEHNKILDIFNDVYIDSMAHKRTTMVEVCERLKVGIQKHAAELDSTLLCAAENAK